MSGTLTPTPYQTVLDATGVAVPNAQIWTWEAGGTVPAATYTDPDLNPVTHANGNPILAGSDGRFIAYLVPGQSYCFEYQTALGVPIETVDNIEAVPSSSANLDVLGIAGTTITAGQGVYLSAGDGGLNAGQWYPWDATTNPYSSTLPEIGMAPEAIVSGATGTIRRGGRVEGLSGLTAGTDYYISTTAGALTATPPTLARLKLA